MYNIYLSNLLQTSNVLLVLSHNLRYHLQSLGVFIKNYPGLHKFRLGQWMIKCSRVGQYSKVSRQEPYFYQAFQNLSAHLQFIYPEICWFNGITSMTPKKQSKMHRPKFSKQLQPDQPPPPSELGDVLYFTILTKPQRSRSPFSRTVWSYAQTLHRTRNQYTRRPHLVTNMTPFLLIYSEQYTTSDLILSG